MIFDNHIIYSIIEELPDYYGISFQFKNDKVEIIHHIHLGYRLLISNNDYHSKDIPFSQQTEYWLGDNIKIQWNNDT